MANYKDIKIFQSMYIVCLDVHKICSKFNRDHKFGLGEKIEEICRECLTIIVKVNFTSDKEKTKLLAELDFKKEELVVFLRLSFDLKQISGGQLGMLNKKINEIGLQIGGWQKWLNK